MLFPLNITASPLNFSPPPTKEVGAFAEDFNPMLFVVVDGPKTEKRKIYLID